MPPGCRRGWRRPSGELREGMAVMAGAHRRELEARDVVIAGQAEVIAGQADRIAQLERRLGRDSSSSSRPPSSDSPFTKGRARSLRAKTGRPPGKQPGAPGRTLGLSDDPDEIIECAPAGCGRCGRDLTGEPAVRTERRQRWDITPPPPPYITGYRKITRVCPCCQAASAGQVPADVTSRVVYGPETRAHAANLVSGHHVPVLRAALLLLRQMAGIKVSTGWMAAIRGRAAAALAPFMEHVAALLRTAPALNADETPARAAKSLAYARVACTRYLTHLHVAGRSAGDTGAGGVLPGCTGVLMRDGYAGYAHLTGALHAWCGAHLLRDLKDICDFEPARQRWAPAMADLLLQANARASQARAAGTDRLNPDTP